MHVKSIVDENFQDYKLPSMFICAASCDMKCCQEQEDRERICQNAKLLNEKTIEIRDSEILKRYLANPLTKAVVVAGLEPMLQFDELVGLIYLFREQGCKDDFVIYTGYNKDELPIEWLSALAQAENVIVKFGRYVPNRPSVYDPILGVELASDNQYAVRLLRSIYEVEN